MKSLVAALALTTALSLPGIAMAQKVVFTTQLKHFRGYPAYLAYYVTNSAGKYVGTMWLAGSRLYFFHHMRGWMRISHGDFSAAHGLSGASVGSGKTLTITFNLPKGLFDAGYTLHIDSASEYERIVSNDIEVKLSTADANKVFHGKGYINTFTYKM